jgi:hypothetical protein
MVPGSTLNDLTFRFVRISLTRSPALVRNSRFLNRAMLALSSRGGGRREDQRGTFLLPGTRGPWQRRSIKRAASNRRLRRADRMTSIMCAHRLCRRHAVPGAYRFPTRGFTLQASNGSEGYLLQANLEEFTQAFTAPAESQCIVQVSASLWRSADQIVAQRVFRHELPAQTPDARGAADTRLFKPIAVPPRSGEDYAWPSTGSGVIDTSSQTRR